MTFQQNLRLIVLGLLHLPPTVRYVWYRHIVLMPQGWPQRADSAKLATTMNHTETVNLNDIAMGAYAGSYDVARLLDGQAIETRSVCEQPSCGGTNATQGRH